MSKTIKEILEGLTPAEKARLNYAFEQGIQQYVELEAVDGMKRFIGVNCKTIPILQIDSEIGVWSTGSIKGKYQ